MIVFRIVLKTFDPDMMTHSDKGNPVEVYSRQILDALSFHGPNTPEGILKNAPGDVDAVVQCLNDLVGKGIVEMLWISDAAWEVIQFEADMVEFKSKH